MEDVYGYDANFIDLVPDDLKCGVCMMALKLPMQLADCGHRFCYDCFMKVKDSSALRYETYLNCFIITLHFLFLLSILSILFCF